MDNLPCHLKESQSLILLKKCTLVVVLANQGKSWSSHNVCNSYVTRLHVNGEEENILLILECQ